MQPQVTIQLRERIGDLARHLCGTENKAMSSKAQLRFGSKGSLAVEIDGEKAGTFFDHEAGEGGDTLALIQYKQGFNKQQAITWAREWLGLESQASNFKNKKSRKETVADIIAQSVPVKDTEAELYLRGRGIAAPLPDCLRFRSNAYGKYGALVAFSTNDVGDVLALQQIYVTDNGQKAPIKVKKRTHKAVDGWAEKANVRFSGKAPVILAEGVETAISIWQATGQETRACLGVSNMAKAPMPKGATVIVARDGDVLDSAADKSAIRAVARLRSKFLRVGVAAPPEGKDFNDVLVDQGEDAVRAAIASAVFPEEKTIPKELQIGSDVELAKRVLEDLTSLYGTIVFSEGDFWHYAETHWEPFREDVLHRAVHPYDGAIYKTATGQPVRTKLNTSRIESTLKQLAQLTLQPDFFSSSPKGINCASGFIRLTQDGQPLLEPHSPDLRCRHTLVSKWTPHANSVPAPNTLFYKLLSGAFLNEGDKDEKILLLGEVFAAAAFRLATQIVQPKAVIFKGETANNGKSQFLDVLRGLFPVSATCSMSAAKMSDQKHVIWLVGKLLNASDELSSSAAIASDVFKKVIVGDPVDGRDVFKSRSEFRPEAQHVFATNILPPFQGGMDSGVARRIIVIPFNRVIPPEERISGLGKKIAEEEADLVLAWVVVGGMRLIKRMNFLEPTSCKDALREWIVGADPVIAWLSECVEFIPEQNGFPVPIPSNKAYASFRDWAICEGYKKERLPAINGFVQRIRANAGAGFYTKRTSASNCFCSFYIKKTAMECL